MERFSAPFGFALSLYFQQIIRQKNISLSQYLNIRSLGDHHVKESTAPALPQELSLDFLWLPKWEDCFRWVCK